MDRTYLVITFLAASGGKKTMKFRRRKSGDLRYKDNGGTVIFSFATNTPGN